jgi:hypothetical protein
MVRILDPNWAATFALAAAIAHWFLPPLAAIEAQEELEKAKGKLLVVLDKPELHWRMLSPSPSLRKKDTPLGEFIVQLCPRRARPLQERLVVAPRPPR